jgi:Spermidine/putrescine-binding periplasmic protein
MTRRTLFLMGIAGAAGCSRGGTVRLNVFNWSDYVAPDTIPNFEKEFGARVRYATYESNEEMLARVMSGNSGWDVVFPSSYLIQAMRDYSLLRQLDHSLLPNQRNIAEMFQRPVWDHQPRLQFAVHVGRHRDRLQPSALPCPSGLGGSVEFARERQAHHAGRSGGGVRGLPEKDRLLCEYGRPGSASARPPARPSRKSPWCAPM